MAKTKIVYLAKEPDKVRDDYGVLFPNGDVIWNTHGFDLSTKKGQAEFKENYERQLKNNYGVAADITFIKRSVTISYSEITLYVPPED